MKLKIITILYLSLFYFQGFSQSGKLEKAKESLTDKNQNNGTKSVQKKARTIKDKDKIINPFTRIFVAIFTYTAYGVLIESPFEHATKMHDAEIATYPYKKSTYGNFVYANNTDYAIARLDVSNQFIFENKDLYGNHLQAKFRFLKRMDLTADYLKLYEKTITKTATFSLANAMLNYHRIRTQKLDVWLGLGMMYVGEEVHKFGFSYGVGTEWFVKKPISLLASINATTINDRNVSIAKILFKYHLKKYHFSTGYEAFTLGVSSVKSFSVGIGVSF